MLDKNTMKKIAVHFLQRIYLKDISTVNFLIEYKNNKKIHMHAYLRIFSYNFIQKKNK